MVQGAWEILALCSRVLFLLSLFRWLEVLVQNENPQVNIMSIMRWLVERGSATAGLQVILLMSLKTR